MGLEVDGKLTWRPWRMMGMHINGEGKFARIESDGDDACYIWYRVTDDGFEGLEDDATIDSLEELYNDMLRGS